MEIVDLFAVFIPDNVAQMAIVHALRAVFGIPDDFIDKVAEVQNETEPIMRSGTLVFEDHTAICALGAVIRVLTTDESKAHGSGVAR